MDDNPPRGQVAQARPEMGQVAEDGDLFLLLRPIPHPEAKKKKML